MGKLTCVSIMNGLYQPATYKRVLGWRGQMQCGRVAKPGERCRIPVELRTGGDPRYPDHPKYGYEESCHTSGGVDPNDASRFAYCLGQDIFVAFCLQCE